MKELKCSNCHGTLTVFEDYYFCQYCESRFEKQVVHKRVNINRHITVGTTWGTYMTGYMEASYGWK